MEVCYSCGEMKAEPDCGNLCEACPGPNFFESPYEDFYYLGWWCDHCFNEDARDQYCQNRRVWDLTRCADCNARLTFHDYLAKRDSCADCRHAQ